MKPGDLIVTNGRIPQTPVKPVEGNGYPLGALPMGTTVCMVQSYPFSEEHEVWREAPWSKATILRKENDRVVIERFDHGRMREFSHDQRCQCVVGEISLHRLRNVDSGSGHRQRWLGIMPRSGLWHRKTGDAGRKIKRPKPMVTVEPPPPNRDKMVLMSHEDHGRRGRWQPKRWKMKSKMKQTPLQY